MRSSLRDELLEFQSIAMCFKLAVQLLLVNELQDHRHRARQFGSWALCVRQPMKGTVALSWRRFPSLTQTIDLTTFQNEEKRGLFCFFLFDMTLTPVK